MWKIMYAVSTQAIITLLYIPKLIKQANIIIIILSTCSIHNACKYYRSTGFKY